MRKFILRNKLIITVCVLILAFGLGWWAWADAPTQTEIGEDIIVKGSVGIGTTTPSAPLQVEGATVSDTMVTLGTNNSAEAGDLNPGYYVWGPSGTTAYGLKLQYTGTEYGTMMFGPNQSDRFLGFGKIGAALEDDDMVEYMRIDLDDGNVGIATSTPQAKLHVSGVSGSTIGFIVDSRMRTDGDSAGLWVEADDTDWFIGRSGTNLRLWAGADKVTFTQSGNVGIGTTDPSYPLHVNGDVLVQGADLVFSDGGSTNVDHISYSDGTYVNSGGYYVFNADTTIRNEPATAAIKAEDAYFNGSLGVGIEPSSSYNIYSAGGSYGIRASGSTMGGRFEGPSSGVVYVAYSDYGIYQSHGTKNYFSDAVGIGDSSPTGPLSIEGLDSKTGGSCYLRYDTGTNEVYCYSSSERYKDDIQPLEEDFYKIFEAEPKTFIDKASGQRNIGYIAEELEEAGLQHLVAYNEYGQPQSVEYPLITLYLNEIVQDQQEEIESLKKQISQLRKDCALVDCPVSDIEEEALDQ